MCFDALGNVAGSLIQGQAQQGIANSEGQTQADLQGQSIQTQLDYENKMGDALRQAIGGVTAQGNPWEQALQQAPPPRHETAALGNAATGVFGPAGGATPTASATPATTPLTAGIAGGTGGGGMLDSGSSGSPPGQRRNALVQGLTAAAA